MTDSKATATESTRLLDPDVLVPQAAIQALESIVDDPQLIDDDIKWLREQRSLNKSLKWYKRPMVSTVSAVIFLFVLCQIIYVPTIVTLTTEKACNEAMLQDDTIKTCSDPKVQELISSLSSKQAFANGAMSVLALSKLGQLSDRLGRRPIMAFAIFIGLLNTLVQVFIIWPGTPFKSWVFISAGLINGIGGDLLLFVSVIESYITDIVEPHERVTSLGFAMGAEAAGTGLGPLIGSFIIRTTGREMNNIYISVVITVLLLVSMLFVFPESRHHELRSESKSMHLQRKASFASQMSSSVSTFDKITATFHSLSDNFKILKSLWIPRHIDKGYLPRFNVVILASIGCLLALAADNVLNILILYAIFFFGTTAEQIGYFITETGFMMTAALYLFAPVLSHYLRKRFEVWKRSPDHIDLITILFGIVCELMVPIAIVFGKSSNVLFIIPIFTCLGAIVTPALHPTIVKYAPESSSGEIFGAMARVEEPHLNGWSFIGAMDLRIQCVFEPLLVFYLIIILYLVAAVLTTFLRLHGELDISGFNQNIYLQEEEEG